MQQVLYLFEMVSLLRLVYIGDISLRIVYLSTLTHHMYMIIEDCTFIYLDSSHVHDHCTLIYTIQLLLIIRVLSLILFIYQLLFCCLVNPS